LADDEVSRRSVTGVGGERGLVVEGENSAIAGVSDIEDVSCVVDLDSDRSRSSRLRGRCCVGQKVRLSQNDISGGGESLAVCIYEDQHSAVSIIRNVESAGGVDRNLIGQAKRSVVRARATEKSFSCVASGWLGDSTEEVKHAAVEGIRHPQRASRVESSRSR